MEHPIPDKTPVVAVAGGIITSLFKALQSEDLTKTVVYAVAGTIASFLTGLMLKQVQRWWRR